MQSNTDAFASLNSNKSFDKDQIDREVCIANISPREQKIRLNVAAALFVISLVILGGMILLRIDPLWRLLLFFLFSASTVTYFQVRDKT